MKPSLINYTIKRLRNHRSVRIILVCFYFYNQFRYEKPEENALELFTRTKNLCDNSKNVGGYGASILESDAGLEYGLGYDSSGIYGTQATTSGLVRVYSGKTYAISHLGQRRDRFHIVYPP